MSSADRYEQAAHRGIDWLLSQLKPDGSYGEADLACYYKSPSALALAGHPRQARRLLAVAVERFRTEDGDFVTSAGVKSANPIFGEFWSYPNGWLALGAARLGWLGVAHEAYAHLRKYRTPDGAFSANDSGIPDAISTAHLGYLALTLGDLDTAATAATWLFHLLAQPDPAARFYLRTDENGPRQSDDSPLHVLSTGAPDQPYFMIGYPLAFLTRLHQVSGHPDHLVAAQSYAEYAHLCGDNLIRTPFSHKVGWGAAILARHTGDQRHQALATGIADHLLSLQGPNGNWSPDGPAHATFDDTAEIAHWLLEIAAELPG
ncbi:MULTISPECIES: hypothetical protein [unclassified Crossiella]|uniref:hypothetical protein n=1 Tax=unclassified Crossiella TaxID=2620835 RepID=UPI001FFF52C5|nr:MULTISPECIES: hypothetical protein [unclassified Crossiella]MCK2238941.1 hypothetical protein [Crossiella sp. S99.2]MCK2251489.1 hypothetical protein [Crossiella sp. S99.1]